MSTLSLNTYAGLQDAIAQYLKRNNLTDYIPTAIALAEVRMNRDLNKLPASRTIYTFTPTQFVNNLPGDFSAMDRVVYNGCQLEFISSNLASSLRERHGNNEYTIVGNKLWIQTSLDGVNKMTYYYFRNIDPLNESNSSNWMLADSPDVYLYASLLECALYITDDAQVAKWTQFYSTAATALTTSSKESLTTNAKLVIRKG